MNLVIYHDNCVDGFAAAWVAHRALAQQGQADVRLFPASYGQEPPYELAKAARRVFILDFSYPRTEMERLIEACRKMVCLDHHKTAEAALAGLSGCQFGDGESGVMMAWRYFRPADAMPELIRRISDNDTGQRQMPHASEYGALIGSFPFTLKDYDDLNSIFEWEHPDLLLEIGAAIRREQKKRVELTIMEARPVWLTSSCVAMVVNCADRSQFSSAGVKMAEKSTSGVGGCWYLRSDGIVEWSLRSLKPEQAEPLGLPSVDVAELAKLLGGGGHRHAAGFTQSLRQLTEMLGGPDAA